MRTHLHTNSVARLIRQAPRFFRSSSSAIVHIYGPKMALQIKLVRLSCILIPLDFKVLSLV